MTSWARRILIEQGREFARSPCDSFHHGVLSRPYHADQPTMLVGTMSLRALVSFWTVCHFSTQDDSILWTMELIQVEWSWDRAFLWIPVVGWLFQLLDLFSVFSASFLQTVGESLWSGKHHPVEMLEVRHPHQQLGTPLRSLRGVKDQDHHRTDQFDDAHRWLSQLLLKRPLMVVLSGAGEWTV